MNSFEKIVTNYWNDSLLAFFLLSHHCVRSKTEIQFNGNFKKKIKICKFLTFQLQSVRMQICRHYIHQKNAATFLRRCLNKPSAVWQNDHPLPENDSVRKLNFFSKRNKTHIMWPVRVIKVESLYWISCTRRQLWISDRRHIIRHLDDTFCFTIYFARVEWTNTNSNFDWWHFENAVMILLFCWWQWWKEKK